MTRIGYGSSANKFGLTSEAAFQRQLIATAKLFGYEVYHTHRAQFSPAGFPDLVLCRPPRIIYLELKGYDAKGRRGQPTADQQMWLEALAACGQVALCCWPEEGDAVVALIARDGN